MRKQVEESVATGAAAGRGRGGRFSAGRKREVVMRLLSRVRVAGGGDHGGAGVALAGSVSGCGAGGPRDRMLGTTTTVGCRPRSASC